MRWLVVLVGIGLVVLGCGGASKGRSPSTKLDAASGGRDGHSAAGAGGMQGNVGGATAGGGMSAGGTSTVSGGGNAAAYCPCGSDDPVCVMRVAGACESRPGCPPTLDDKLDYTMLPHDPNERAYVTYAVCDDGTSQFSESDSLRESHTWLVFDAQGNLTYDYAGFAPICGTQPPLEGVMCRYCQVLRAGGLAEVGQSGAGGEGGASPVATDESGIPYCLVDGDGRLVMPAE